MTCQAQTNLLSWLVGENFRPVLNFPTEYFKKKTPFISLQVFTHEKTVKSYFLDNLPVVTLTVFFVWICKYFLSFLQPSVENQRSAIPTFDYSVWFSKALNETRSQYVFWDIGQYVFWDIGMVIRVPSLKFDKMIWWITTGWHILSLDLSPCY